MSGGSPGHVRKVADPIRAASIWVLKAVADLIGRTVDPPSLAQQILQRRPDRDRTTRRALVRLAALLEPTPTDVVAAYISGQAVLGIASGTDLRYQFWRSDQRSVITAESRRISRSMRALRRRAGFEVRFDQDFRDIVIACRRDAASWITPEIIDLYDRVDACGFGVSVGVYRDGVLVGGSWGLLVGRTLGVMSTFHRADSAGTVAQLALMDELGPDGRWDLIDMTQPRPSYDRLGAFTVTEERFRAMLLANLLLPRDGGARR